MASARESRQFDVVALCAALLCDVTRTPRAFRVDFGAAAELCARSCRGMFQSDRRRVLPPQAMATPGYALVTARVLATMMTDGVRAHDWARIQRGARQFAEYFSRSFEID